MNDEYVLSVIPRVLALEETQEVDWLIILVEVRRKTSNIRCKGPTTLIPKIGELQLVFVIATTVSGGIKTK